MDPVFPWGSDSGSGETESGSVETETGSAPLPCRAATNQRQKWFCDNKYRFKSYLCVWRNSGEMGRGGGYLCLLSNCIHIFFRFDFNLYNPCPPFCRMHVIVILYLFFGSTWIWIQSFFHLVEIQIQIPTDILTEGRRSFVQFL